MSHEITKTDGLVLAGTPAWHGLGTVLPEAPTVAEAIKVAGLDWKIVQRPLVLCEKKATGWNSEANDGAGEAIMSEEPSRARTEDGEELATEWRYADKWVANVREDTGEIMGIVTESYTPAQNEEIGGLIIDAAQSQGVRIESAGSLRGGREVFFLAHLNTFEALPGDVSHTYALFHNGHGGSRALTVAPTDTRVVCANTRRLALGTAERLKLDLKINLRHSKNLADKLPQIREVLVRQAEMVKVNELEAKALAGREMTDEEVREFFRDAYAFAHGRLILPGKDAGADALKKYERAKKKAVEIVGQWIGNLESEQTEFKSAPNAWLAYNATSKWSDHQRSRVKDPVYAGLFGTGAKFKGKSYEAALALVN